MKQLLISLAVALKFGMCLAGDNGDRQEDADAQYVLGYNHYYTKEKNSVDYYTKDLVEAVKCFRNAAEQGHIWAQWELGHCYAEGDGVEKNMVEAAKWYRKAAEQGHSWSQWNLANCYAGGEGVESNMLEAVMWYRKAAEQGVAWASYHLADCYAKGTLGVAPNMEEAKKWYRRAAEQGLLKARNELAVVAGEIAGLFGRQFGEVSDVDSAEYIYVSDWGTAFWRVKFESQKKSTAFQDYYLWVTLTSHKVFAIEARSNELVPDGFLELLEERYQRKFTKDGDVAEMFFPTARCSLKVFGETSGADRAGAAMVTAVFADALLGDRGADQVLGEYCEDVEKRKRQKKCYRFSKNDNFTSLIVAEDIALSALAKKEAEELWERRRKAEEQKKKREAEEAASAF